MGTWRVKALVRKLADNVGELTPEFEQTTEWCNGLPLKSERPLSGGEEAELRVQAAKRRRAHFLVDAGYLAFCLATMAVSMTFGFGNGVLVAMCLVALLLLPFKIVIARDCSKEGKALKLDLKAGKVKQFTGLKLENVDLGFKLTPIPPGTPLDFEVLAGSGRLDEATNDESSIFMIYIINKITSKLGKNICQILKILILNLHVSTALVSGLSAATADGTLTSTRRRKP